MSNLKEIPFTELFERVQDEVRDKSTGTATEAKYKGRINDIYQRDLPGRYKWSWLRKAGTVQTNADYATGTVAVAVAGSDLTGTDTVWTTGMSNRIIKFGSNEDIYTFTYVSATTATISPAYTGATALTEDTYSIIDNDYSLASDFVDGELTEVYYWKNSQRQYLTRATEEGATSTQNNSRKISQSLVPATPDKFWIYGTDSSGYEVMYLTPPPTTALLLYYDYEQILDPMTEYTTGTCATVNDDETVTGTGTDFTNNVAAGDVFRMDGNGTSSNSTWYTVDSITDATHLELTAVWGQATASTAAYTICKKPVAIPYYMHDALVWGSCMLSAMDQGDQRQVAYFTQMFTSRVNEGKRRQERKIKNKRVKTIYEVKSRSAR